MNLINLQFKLFCRPLKLKRKINTAINIERELNLALETKITINKDEPKPKLKKWMPVKPIMFKSQIWLLYFKS